MSTERPIVTEQLTATVLITAHNEAPTIHALVRRCLEQPYPIDRVIVVADSCDDDTAAIARKAGAHVVETDFKDKASNQNAVLHDIHTDVIVGFDGDTMPEMDCIPLMMKDIASGKDATCSTILPWQEKGFFVQGRRFSYALGRRWWRWCQAAVGRMQVLTGASYAFRTEAIKAVGGFPNGLISADMDATWALHKAGYRVGYAAKAVSLTMEPENFTVYRNQIRRWSAGYFQNMAKYKRQLLNWRSLLVVGTALFDLLFLFIGTGYIVWAIANGRGLWVLRTYYVWWTIQYLAVLIVVATVIGWKQTLRGFVPFLCLTFYNKWVYLCSFGREWILGRHYTSWTGRQGRAVVITSMSQRRRATLSLIAAASVWVFALAVSV